MFLRDILKALYSNVFLIIVYLLYHNNFTDLCIYLETYQKYEYAKSLHGQITIGKYWIKYELMQNIWLWCFSNPHLLHYSHVEWNGNRSTFVSIYIITLYCILHEGRSFCMKFVVLDISHCLQITINCIISINLKKNHASKNVKKITF